MSCSCIAPQQSDILQMHAFEKVLPWAPGLLSTPVEGCWPILWEMTSTVVVLALSACRSAALEALEPRTINWQQRTPGRLRKLPLVPLPSMLLLCWQLVAL
jgi:hypothetical protein